VSLDFRGRRGALRLRSSDLQRLADRIEARPCGAEVTEGIA